MNDPNLSISKDSKPSIENVESSITKKLSTLYTDPGKSYTVCIYRVSGKYRKVNEEAYTPRLVSIGPLHHGKSELQAMEAYKLSCLRSFAYKNQVDMKKLIKFVANEESNVRGCYEGTIIFSPDLFTEIILLDGVFVVELLLKNRSLQLRDRNDAIYENRWMRKDVLHDMLLLENQLPISILKGLFKFVKFEPRCELEFYDVVRDYFKDVGNTEKLLPKNGGKPLERAYWREARHLVELLMYLHWPSRSEMQALPTRKFEYTRSAAELEEAGVIFQHVKESCLFEVSFENGVLKIPQLTVNDNTETFFRNSIVFEQSCYYGKNVTSYVILMDSLISTGKDVDLLVKYEIIKNLLGESEKVADLFNNLYKDVLANVLVKERDFYFAHICNTLAIYKKDRWHVWKSTRFRWTQKLKRSYIRNPSWSALSVAAASFLLCLTIIQTVCSLLSVM